MSRNFTDIIRSNECYRENESVSRIRMNFLNFSIFMHVGQTKRAISNAKHAIGLKLGGRLALG